MSLRVATRIDPGRGLREDACFLPVHGDDLFCVLHRPAGFPHGAVVICCSLYAEQLKLYRTEVLAARALAAAGFAVARFHYRGTGHSGGLGEAATLATMLEDTAVAAAFLHQDHALPLCFVGGRWGALIAGLAAAQRPGAALALWEPVIDARRFFQEMLRARQLGALAGGVRVAVAGSEMIAELHRTGYVDALGYPIHRSLYESAEGQGLMNVPARGPRPVLLAQVSRREELRPEAAALRDLFSAAGSAVTTALIPGEEAWSFIGSPVRSTDGLIAVTRSFLTALLARSHV